MEFFLIMTTAAIVIIVAFACISANWSVFYANPIQQLKGYYRSSQAASELEYVGKKFPMSIFGFPCAIYWFCGDKEQHVMVADEMAKRKIVFEASECILIGDPNAAHAKLSLNLNVWPSREVASWFGEEEVSWYPELGSNMPDPGAVKIARYKKLALIPGGLSY